MIAEDASSRETTFHGVFPEEQQTSVVKDVTYKIRAQKASSHLKLFHSIFLTSVREMPLERTFSVLPDPYIFLCCEQI